MTAIASTHSREILQALAFEVEESGLRKGGHIIEDELDPGGSEALYGE